MISLWRPALFASNELGGEKQKQTLQKLRILKPLLNYLLYQTR